MYLHDFVKTLYVTTDTATAPPPSKQSTESPTQNTLEKSRLYSRIKVRLGIISTILFFIVTLVIVVSGLSRWMENIGYSVTDSPYLALLIFAFLFGLISGVVTFPIQVYGGYFLEHRFKLSNQSFGAWLWDVVKGLLVSAAIGIPILMVFYFFLRTYETSWWIPVGIVMIIVSVLLARIAPILIFPLFYKFKPLDDGEVKERILQRCNDAKMNVEGVYQFDMSKKTRKANAAFTGIGKAKRIILGDTLLNDFSTDEIDVVFTHELGHYKKGHIRKLIVTGIVGTFAGLFIAAQLYKFSLEWFGFGHVAELAALPLLTIWLGVYSLLTGPFENWLSRRFEYEADRFALFVTKNKDAFVSTMTKLAEMNLSDPEPPRWVEVLFHSHPTIKKRIQAAEQFSESKT